MKKGIESFVRRLYGQRENEEPESMDDIMFFLCLLSELSPAEKRVMEIRYFFYLKKGDELRLTPYRAVAEQLFVEGYYPRVLHPTSVSAIETRAFIKLRRLAHDASRKAASQN